MFNQPYINAPLVADMLSISKRTLVSWGKNGKLKGIRNDTDGSVKYLYEDLKKFKIVNWLDDSKWEQQSKIKPLRNYSSIELFAGGGGLALGLEKAGFKAELLNELDRDACKTLRFNRPDWNIVEGSVTEIDFTKYQGIDFLSGGFPCQAFSYAGNKLGFEDTRGTLFFEFARAVKETNPKVFLAENVKGLLSHDEGKTLTVIKKVIDELGYYLVEPKVLKAMFYKVPQKRERLMLVGIRKDLMQYADDFQWPTPYGKVLTVKDALKVGELYNTNVPKSAGQTYPQRKKEILAKVPAGGYWRDLPDDLQREYMMKSYYLGGGKTGVARRLSWEEPSLTLTCAPAQKQTERCHPEETRPLTIREYARIQTFPDNWQFCGANSNQYKQIGNAVPVNLAFAIGKSLISLLNTIEIERK
jgi:DNA (cytosine-5)-methyltransferase 1